MTFINAYQFHVRDNGPGFKKDDFKKMFRRFQPLSAKPTGGEPTLGMGLHLAKKLSDQMNILLEIKNHPEKGAIASLKLPIST